MVALPEDLLKNVDVDTTVQEKAITFPTDTKLCHRMRIKLIAFVKKRKIELRQTYVKSMYYAGSLGSCKKVRCYLGRVIRDIQRKTDLSNNPELGILLFQSERLLKQEKHTSMKLYSLHAAETESIAKDKAHKRYEFGCKVSVVTTCKDPCVLSIQAYPSTCVE